MASRRAGRSDRFSSDQARAARALLGWSICRLATAADLETEALEIFEAGQGDLAEPELRRLGAAIRDAGVIAVRAAMAGEGVRFRHPVVTGADGPPRWLPLADDDESAPEWPGSLA